jgi:hypothetical protein
VLSPNKSRPSPPRIASEPPHYITGWHQFKTQSASVAASGSANALIPAANDGREKHCGRADLPDRDLSNSYGSNSQHQTTAAPTTGSAISPPPIISDIAPHPGKSPDAMQMSPPLRNAKKQALSKLQNLNWDIEPHVNKKKLASRDSLVPLASKQVIDLTNEKRGTAIPLALSTASPSAFKNVLQPKGALSSKPVPSARNVWDIPESQESSGHGRPVLGKATQNTVSPPMAHDPQSLTNAPSGRSYRMWNGECYAALNSCSLLSDYRLWSAQAHARCSSTRWLRKVDQPRTPLDMPSPVLPCSPSGSCQPREPFLCKETTNRRGEVRTN